MNRKILYGRLWNKLLNFNRQNKLIKPADKILVGLSGGADSVCLLDYLVKLSKKIPIEITCCHINHGLRGKDAEKDVKFTEKLCKKLDIDLIIKKADTKKYAKKYRLSIEHSARSLRYKIFAQTARKYKCNKIATAHQLDDHIETIILNMIRGTNPKGLLGIPLKRKLNPKSKLTVIRPVLCLTRKEILEYLKQNKLTYRTDKTNKSLKFTRNWIRHKLIPMLELKQPQLKKHMLEMSGKLVEIFK
jgi:tRNA(Ile)-lysidine synthase